MMAALAAAQGRTAPCAECVTLVLNQREPLALPVPLNGARIALKIRPGEEQSTLSTLSQIRDAGGNPGLVIAGVPQQALADEAVRRVGHLFLDISPDESETTLPIDETAFRLKTRFAELRGQASGMTLGLIATAAQRQQLLERDIEPYVDVVAEPLRTTLPAAEWLSAGSPYAANVAETSDGSPRSRVLLWTAPRDRTAAGSLVSDLARAMPLLAADLVPGRTAGIWCGARALPTYLNPKTLEVIAVARECDVSAIEVKPATSAAEKVTLSSGAVIIRVPAAEGRFADDVSVVGKRDLTVEEVVARHQAAAARQRSVVRTLISAGTMTLTFEAPGFAAPVAITSETVIFEGEGHTEIEQRSIRVNGIEFRGGRVPRLPIIEPERVASPPLVITLSDLYHYSLAGREPCGYATCYIVYFDPIDSRRALFRGRAWISADEFAMVRVAATQTGLRGPIVSSEQIDEFTRQSEGVWLLSRSEVRQVYEGAGHRTPIHRVLTVSSHQVNPPDFVARRREAYNSASVMLRDTPDGFRYLQRNPGADQAVEPVTTGPANRVRTLVTGVIVDPNISRPLPFAGLSYVDFDLFGTGTQLNAFFGGTYGQLAFLVPSLGGTRWQLAGRAFGIVSSFNDRAFERGREMYERNITQRPAHGSVWTLRPLTTRLTLRAGYELDYTQFSASELTAASFTVPADQVAHSVRAALEGQRAGWNGSLWWAGSRRSGWRAWGSDEDDFRQGHADYQRYGVTVTRPFVLSPTVLVRVEAAWMDGHDLDRFSRYAFGTFDNRLRGYPSALIRYDRGGVVRGAVAWAAGRRLRVDGFLDSAYVHDPGFGPNLRSYSGVGGAIEVPAPFGMLAGVEWGYGLQGVNSSGRRGTQVVRVTAFKIF